MEINFNHGDALELADQAFLFKRTLRQAALKHGIYATFMAKPMAGGPQLDARSSKRVRPQCQAQPVLAAGRRTQPGVLLVHRRAAEVPGAAMPLLAPKINSYRRLRRWSTAPINVHWGIENRTVGLRLPISSPEARRVENRIAGADANPYLAMAASLACGWLGIIGEIEPSDPIKGTAYRLAQSLPQQMPEALRKLQQSGPLKEVLGEHFVEVLLAVKQTEHDAYQRVISSWEREHLLLNV